MEYTEEQIDKNWVRENHNYTVYVWENVTGNPQACWVYDNEVKKPFMHLPGEIFPVPFETDTILIVVRQDLCVNPIQPGGVLGVGYGCNSKRYVDSPYPNEFHWFLSNSLNQRDAEHLCGWQDENASFSPTYVINYCKDMGGKRIPAWDFHMYWDDDGYEEDLYEQAERLGVFND